MAFNLGRLKDWTDIESSFGLTVEPSYKLTPLSRVTITLYCISLERKLSEELNKIKTLEQVSTQVTKAGQIKLSRPYTYTDGKHVPITLFEEQAESAEICLERLKDPAYRSQLIRATTGGGKTFMLGAIICELIKQNAHKDWVGMLPSPYIVFTRKSVVATIQRWFGKMGIGRDLVTVFSYSDLTSSQWDTYWKEETIEDEEGNEQTQRTYWDFAKPFFVGFDESQGLNNWFTKRTQAAVELEKPSSFITPLVVRCSATPFVCLNDTKSFVLSTGVEWLGMKVTETNFNQFIAQFGRDPDLPNEAAMQRFAAYMDRYIIQTRAVPWPAKAFNSVVIADFKSESDRQYYGLSMSRYLDFCRRAGKNPPQMQVMVARGQFFAASEFCKTPQIVEWLLEDLRHKKCGLASFNTRNAFTRAVMLLEEAGIPRHKMSLIWGGGVELKPSERLSLDELNEILRKIRFDGLVPDRKLMYRVRQSEMLALDEARNDDGLPGQAARLAKMKALGLHRPQEQWERQDEMDRFQEGETLVCLYTTGAGGVGISLDHCTPASFPRSNYLQILWSAHTFAQSMGRDYRRATITDVYRKIPVLRGTIEVTHVAPKLTHKLKSVAAIARGHVKYVDLMDEIDLAAQAEDFNPVTFVDDREGALVDSDSDTDNSTED